MRAGQESRGCGRSNTCIDVREENGMLYTQTLFNRFHYWKMMLRIEIAEEQEERHGNDHD